MEFGSFSMAKATKQTRLSKNTEGEYSTPALKDCDR